MSPPAVSDILSRVGTVLAGKYRLTRLLGAGGMGAVYDALNTWTERRVAVKLMLGDSVRDPELAARFLREARAAGRIQHPSVVDILDMGQDSEDGSLFIVQEFLAGNDLRQVLDQRGTLPAKEALEIVTPVMAALVAAHARGVVHRDLKPENIFLAKTTAGVVPKLIDFGIARLMEPGTNAALTRTGSAVGTPLYMSPEQAKGERDVDAQTDVWAMGVVLFECMSGCVPFEGANYNAVIAAIMMGAIPRLDMVAPSVPREIADVVARALSRERSRRYRSMQQFLGDLLECPTYQAESWHQSLRSTHRTALEPQPARDTLDEELIVTPPVANAAAPSGSFGEGRSSMEKLGVTTLGRTAREVGVPARSMSRSWLPGTAAIALIGIGAFVAAVTFGGRRTSPPHIAPVTSPPRPIVAAPPIVVPTTLPAEPVASPTPPAAPATSITMSPAPSAAPVTSAVPTTAPGLTVPARRGGPPRSRETQGILVPRDRHVRPPAPVEPAPPRALPQRHSPARNGAPVLEQ